MTSLFIANDYFFEQKTKQKQLQKQKIIKKIVKAKDFE